MTDQIHVESDSSVQVQNERIEIVERKGKGHPDSIADGLSESISRALCERYRDVYGHIAHHNTDEVQIIGGQSVPSFGGGMVQQPTFVLLGGRATHEYDGQTVDVNRVAVKAAESYLETHLPHLDVDGHVVIESRIGRGSSDLTEMYGRGDEVPLANDTSFGIGHAPLSETERVVMRVEEGLNSRSVKRAYPFVGEDIKIMACREGTNLDLTVAVAFVDRYVTSVQDYFNKKERLQQEIREIALEYTDHSLEVDVNTADGRTKDELYLTVTGTSAEMGDDGSTGRGNRVSGLITPQRSMSLEASSGKNPVAHVGKIYNVLAHKISEEIVERVRTVESAEVELVSQIGHPIDDPQTANVRVAPRNGAGLDTGTETEIETISREALANLPTVVNEVTNGTISTF